MNIIIFWEASGDRQYDQIGVVPDGMSKQKANNLASKIIRKIRNRNPMEYQWGDIQKELEAVGFTFPNFIECREAW